MLLGGSGLVGHAVARRVLGVTPPPGRLVLVALYEDEVRAAARAIEPYRGSVRWSLSHPKRLPIT